MNVEVSKQFKKSYDCLPLVVRRKTKRTIEHLRQDFFYPSLNTKKLDDKTWEVRVDYHYRITFEKQKDKLILRTVGMHDKGLGKK